MLRYADAIFALLDDAYNYLNGVTPLTHKQVDVYIKQHFSFISPDFAPIVVDENDDLIAFGITLPLLSDTHRKAKGRIFPFGFVHLLCALKKNDKSDFYLVAVKHMY